MGTCLQFISKVSDYLFLRDSNEKNYSISDYELLMQAREELDSAQKIFAAIEDPEMVDWAVFNLRAAEERYDILIRKMKRY